jgi:hypothetical protein
MVLLGLLLAAVAIALGVGLALQPGTESTTVHFFGLNLPNLNGRTLILIGVGIGILFMVGLTFIRSGLAAASRRRRERKALKAAAVEPKREPAGARDQEAPPPRQEAVHREPDRDAARRHEEAARRQEEAWERAEAARREEAARQEEAALRQRAELHQPDPYAADPYGADPYQHSTGGNHRPPEPYRGDSHPTEAFPTVDPHSDTDAFPTVDPYGERGDSRPSGTVYQAGGHSYQEPGQGPYGSQPPSYPPR